MSEQNECSAMAVRPQLAPDIWNMLMQIGETVHTSRKFGVTSQQEAAIKLLFCWENNLPLSTANTGLYIVNGRLAVQSNIIAAKVRQSGTYDYRVTRLDNDGCTIQIIRRVEGKWVVEGEASFTKDDAKLAGLDMKDNHRAYPSDMNFARAISRAQRRYAPDVFSGPVYTLEELGGGGVVEGTWRELDAAQPVAVTAPTVEAPMPQPEPAITLNDLVTKYGAEAVMKANGGSIPATPEELESVVDKLDGPQVI